ncbi:MAG: phosphate signaling complex protein PhoU [Rhodospirillaceae bacterium]|nr:phosphate signaling complex protein PhoU [Rhodospirillaceae bacterium]
MAQQHDDNQHIVKSYDDEINSLQRRIIQMGGLVEKQVSEAIRALKDRDVEVAARVIDQDDQVDQMEEAIDKEAIRLLATRQPMAVDLRLIAMALKISNDLERIGDYATNMARRSISLAKQPPLKPLYTIPHMAQISQAMVKQILDAYVARDSEQAMAAWHRDDEVDQLYDSLFRELMTYMLEDPRHIPTCVDLLAAAKHVERIGDHACNIAEKVHYMVHGERINRMPRRAQRKDGERADAASGPDR